MKLVRLDVGQLGKLYIYFFRKTMEVVRETPDHLWQQEIWFNELRNPFYPYIPVLLYCLAHNCLSISTNSFFYTRENLDK